MNGNVSLEMTLGSSSDISTSHSLVIVYPPGYGNLRASGLSCKITPLLAVGTAAADKIQTPACTITARNVIIPINQTLNKSSSFSVEVNGVEGPEFSSCKSKKLSFGIINEKKEFAYLTTANAINMAGPAYN
jgi:hypothetical protein